MRERVGERVLCSRRKPLLTGLRPGTYDISVTPPGGAAVTRRIIVSVGQTATLDIDTAAPAEGVEDPLVGVVVDRAAESVRARRGPVDGADEVDPEPRLPLRRASLPDRPEARRR